MGTANPNLQRDNIPGKSHHIALGWFAIIAILILGSLIWTSPTLRQHIDVQNIREFAKGLNIPSHPFWVIIGGYLLAAVVLFPVTAVTVMCGLWLPFPQALCAGFIGVTTSSAVGYYLGWLMGPELVQKYLGKIYRKVRKSVANNVLVSVLIIRHIPLGPFTLVNAVLGSMHIDFKKYVLANGLSFLPSIIIAAVVGAAMRG